LPIKNIAVGALIDDLPLIVPANVRPYLIAIVLHRGALAKHELVAALTPHCSMCDLKVGGWSSLEADYSDSTRLETIVDEVLGEFVAQRLLRYNEESLSLNAYLLTLVLPWLFAINISFGQGLVIIGTIKLLVDF
jgi:hypothetical protein